MHLPSKPESRNGNSESRTTLSVKPLSPANRRRHNSFDLPMTVDQDGFPQETESETDLRRTTVQKGQGKDKNNDEGIPCLILNQIDAIEVFLRQIHARVVLESANKKRQAETGEPT